jgi:hypothetical protein
MPKFKQYIYIYDKRSFIFIKIYYEEYNFWDMAPHSLVVPRNMIVNKKLK